MCSKQGLLSFWNHCPYLHVSRNEFRYCHSTIWRLNWALFFICKWSNLSFSRSVWRHCWWNFSWFFWHAGDSFSSVVCLFFFPWTISSWAFFFNCLISSLFRLFRARLWRLFASSDLFQLKKVPQIIKNCSEGVEALLGVYFLFLSLSSVLSFFFVFLSFLSFSDNFNYNCYQLSIHHVPSNERAGLSTLELVKSGKSNFT